MISNKSIVVIVDPPGNPKVANPKGSPNVSFVLFIIKSIMANPYVSNTLKKMIVVKDLVFMFSQ